MLHLGIQRQTGFGDRDSALLCFQKASSLMEGGSVADFRLGTLLCEMDQPEAAAFHLQRYLDTDPDPSRAAYADLACALVRVGRLNVAEDVAARYRNNFPDDHFAFFLAAWVAAKQDKVHDALSFITDCVALDPTWPVPLGLRGMLLCMDGRHEEAVRVLQEMVTLHRGLVASTVSSEVNLTANRLWRQVRSDAKRCLGLRDTQAVNFIVLFGGLGDQIVTASMLRHFRSTYNIPLVVFYSSKADWAALFPGSADLYMQLALDTIRQLSLCNRFFPDHPYTNFFPWQGPLVSLYAQEMVRFNMGLPRHLRGQAPTIQADARLKSLELFQSLGGEPGHSVLISPLSNSNPMVNSSWWQALVDELQKAGFKVFQNMTNAANTTSAAIDTARQVMSMAVPVELPLEQVIPFCEAAGFFIGIRSGLCDLLGHARANMKAVHVSQRYAKNDRYPLSVWLDANSGFSLKRGYRSQYWQDIDIAQDATFDAALIADWLIMA